MRDITCDLCPMSQGISPSNVCIFTESKDAKIVVVTRNVLYERGRKELEQYLTQAGFDISEVTFSAVNRCRNSDYEPKKADQKICVSTYLNPQLERIKPKLIIAVGNEALSATTGRSGIMKYRARPYDHTSGATVIATISPAMVRRSPGYKDGLLSDLRLAYRVYSGDDTAGKKPPLKLMTKLSHFRPLYDALEEAAGLSFDIETTAFDEEGGEIVSLSLTLWGPDATGPESMWVIPMNHPQSPWQNSEMFRGSVLWRKIQEVPERVAHNGKFDLRWMRYHLLDGMTLTFDTMLAAHLLNENRPKGLKPLATSLLGVAPWAVDTKSLTDMSLKKVAVYNALDTWYTAELYFLFKKQLEEKPRLNKLFRRLIIPCSNIFTSIEREGIWTDRELLDQNAEEASRTLARIDAELRSYLPSEDEWPGPINFNPSNFARWFLFEHLGLPILARGKPKDDGSPGNPSMAEAILQKLEADHHHPALTLMLQRTKWQKYSSAFFSAYQELITEEDRIHTTFKLAGTVTGRLSSGKADDDKVTGRVQNRGVNLQQVPRDAMVRGIFGAPPGSVFVECDYSQIELRVAAFLSQDENMLHLYNTGQDIHTAMARRMVNRNDVTKDERKKAKAVNFGFLYGMSARKFISTAWENYGVVVTEQEALAFRDAFFNEFPKLKSWHQKQRRLVHKYGRVQSPIGRVRNLPDIYSQEEAVRAEAQRQAINSPVQSFASDMTLMALVLLDRNFKRMGLRAHSVGTVHDAINFEVPVAEAPRVVPIVRRVMENLPLEQTFGVRLNVPIVADVAVGRRWGGATELPSHVSSSPARVRRALAEIGL